MKEKFKLYLDNSGKVEKRILLVWMVLLVGLLLGAIGGYFIGFSTGEEKGKELESSYKAIESIPEGLEETISDLYFLDYFKKNINSDKDLNNQVVLEWAFRRLKDDENIDYYEEGLSLERVQEEVDKYFNYKVIGEDLFLNFELVNSKDVPIFKYEEESKKFFYNEDFAPGQLYYLDIINIIDKVYNDGNTYKVEVYKGYSDMNEFFPTSYYGSLEDAGNQENKLVLVSYNPELSEEENSKNNDVLNKLKNVGLENLTKVTYEFKEDNGRFILVSYNVG